MKSEQKRKTLSAMLAVLLSLALVGQTFLPAFAEEVTQETTATEAVTEATEAATEAPAEAATEATEAATVAPTEATEEATEPPTEATEEATEPPTEATEEATEPPTEATEEATEAPTEAAEEATEAATEATEEATEAPTEATEEATEAPTEETAETEPEETDGEDDEPVLYITTTQELLDAIAEAEQNAEAEYTLDILADVPVAQAITVPGNVISIVVEPGCTVTITVQGSLALSYGVFMDIRGTVTVGGSFANWDEVFVNHAKGGVLKLDGGTYSGTGDLLVSGSLSEALPGFPTENLSEQGSGTDADGVSYTIYIWVDAPQETETTVTEATTGEETESDETEVPTEEETEPTEAENSDSISEPSVISDSTDWQDWAQTDARWASISMGGGNTYVGIGGDYGTGWGCLVTSLTKLIIQAGLEDPSEFNVGSLVTWMNNNGYFTDGGALQYFDLSSFGLYCIDAKSYPSNDEEILSMVQQGYHFLLNVKNGGHWVSVDEARSLSSGTIYIFDTDASPYSNVTLAAKGYTYGRCVYYTGGSTATTNSTPVGTINSIEGKENSFSISGSAYDPDSPSQALTIQVYVDGSQYDSFSASTSGFDKTYSYSVTESESHTITLYAVDANTGASVSIGSQTITIAPLTIPTISIEEYSHELYIDKSTEAPITLSNALPSGYSLKLSHYDGSNCTNYNLTYESDTAISVKLTGTAIGYEEIKIAVVSSDGEEMESEIIFVDILCDHSAGFTITTQEATCQSPGYQICACETCGYYYYVNDDDNWSEWSSDEPTDVAEALVKKRKIYVTQDKEFTTSESSSLSGWVQSGSETVYGDYGAWSDWSTTEVTASDTTQVQSNAYYRYYYYLCSSCGSHNPLEGGCSCGGQSIDWHEYWVPISYQNSNSTVVSYATYKRETTSLGDGQVYFFSSGNLNDTALWTIDTDSDGAVIKPYYRSRTREEKTIYSYYRWVTAQNGYKEYTSSIESSLSGWTNYSNTTSYGSYGAWSDWSTAEVTASDTTQVETASYYRYYYYLCSSCGSHNPLCGGCSCGGQSVDFYAVWYPISYQDSNSSIVTYATYKRTTTSLGDGQVYFFSTGNLNDTALWTIDTDSDGVVIKPYYRSRTREITTVYNYYRWVATDEEGYEPRHSGNNRKVTTSWEYQYYTGTLSAHSYSNGVCEWCGLKVNNKTAKIAGYDLSLSGNIGVNFYMKLSDEAVADTAGQMIFSLPNGGTTSVTISNAKAVGTYYVFSCEVAAKEMTGTITAQVTFSDGTQSDAYTYSVRDYAEYILNHQEIVAYAAAADLVKAMLNYGAYAQQNFGFNTGNLANAGYEISVSSVSASNVTNYKYTGTGSSTSVKFSGADLILLSETTLRLYFTVTDGASATFKLNGTTVTPTESGSMYYVEIPNITSSSLGTAYTVVATGSDGQSVTVSYSAMSYVYATMTASSSTISSNTALQNTVKALYQYYQAAASYFG